ncbi:hypothetical protein IWQ62_006352 [Dispira parvispora]|uniref:SCP2 domain-containing protein n=1 Tax=Dispira parvispora TaxID=1520584 RepID=A0A9W8AKY1_9FUNG|nr:hypothetical protein IWQ62_006352 [Dispira parvispora]
MPLSPVPDFQASQIFQDLDAAFRNAPPKRFQELVSETKAWFQFQITNASGQSHIWTVNLKTPADGASAVQDGAQGTPDTTLIVKDADFIRIAAGQLNGQQAFMTGKLKLKGNMMLSLKLDGVFRVAKTLVPEVAASTAAQSASSHVVVPGFQSSAVFAQIAHSLDEMAQTQRQHIVESFDSALQFDITNATGKRQTWVLNLTKDAVSQGPFLRLASATPLPSDKKPALVLSFSDESLVAVSRDELTLEEAYMTRKLKLKGNMKLAMQLSSLFKSLMPRANL